MPESHIMLIFPLASQTMLDLLATWLYEPLAVSRASCPKHTPHEQAIVSPKYVRALASKKKGPVPLVSDKCSHKTWLKLWFLPLSPLQKKHRMWHRWACLSIPSCSLVFSIVSLVSSRGCLTFLSLFLYPDLLPPVSILWAFTDDIFSKTLKCPCSPLLSHYFLFPFYFCHWQIPSCSIFL